MTRSAASGPETPEHTGVQFPADAEGRRSSTDFGRAVVAAALAGVDPVGAGAAARETSWRAGYVPHFRRLVEAGMAEPADWSSIAGAGLDAVHQRMTVVAPDGSITALADLPDAPATSALGTTEVAGTGQPETELVLPYRGRRLRGVELCRQVEAWVGAGIAEPSVAQAVATVVAHPQWLRLDGQTVAVLGAGAELGPLAPLLRWGARVAAVDLPNPAVWQRILESARVSAGQLLAPNHDGARAELGTDLVQDPAAVADWLADMPGALTVGNYTYADGAMHVRVSAAIDALSRRLSAHRADVGLAFLATPTDAFVVPGEAVEHSVAAYRDRARVAKLLGRPLRTVSRGRLLQRAYPPGADPGLCDALMPVQGPNYALAKRIQRWRAAVARQAGQRVSFHVAPSTRTRSVVKNRALAAAYAGAHRFGVEVFEPQTANTLMAALLVHDLQAEPVGHAHPRQARHPWQDEAQAAVHGGLWRMPYAPRSVLGLAAVLGYASARS